MTGLLFGSPELLFVSLDNILLFHCVKGDGCLDDGECLDTGERDVFGLKAVVVAYEADAVRAVRLLDIFDYGEEVASCYEREKVDLSPEYAVEG